MNMSGDAAEQVVRLSLEGTEMALRLSGDAAKSVAIAIYTILKNKPYCERRCVCVTASLTVPA